MAFKHLKTPALMAWLTWCNVSCSWWQRSTL